MLWPFERGQINVSPRKDCNTADPSLLKPLTPCRINTLRLVLQPSQGEHEDSMNQRWKEVLVRGHESILKTVEVIDRSGLQIALVTDENGLLLGTVTDGDIRRAILGGVTLAGPVQGIMNKSPVVLESDLAMPAVLERMTKSNVRQLPIVTYDGKIAGLHLLSDVLRSVPHTNPIVIMAGGRGTRLRSLTDSCPKPLLNIGNKPLLENLVIMLAKQGYCRVYLSIHYRGEMIEEYFGDGSKWGVSIEYLKEDTPLGTAGALSLLPGTFSEPIVVLNGDLLTRVDFTQLINFHCEHKGMATMGVKLYEYQVPYGVVQINDKQVVQLVEKPIERHFINAGIYALDPSCLKLVPHNTPFNMTDLFDRILESGGACLSFPLTEYWLDVGQPEDFARATQDVSSVLHDQR